jgi:hydrogenase maturation protein HypF
MIFQRIRVSGVVHGVGYRPFVWRLAKELNLTGWVRNDAHGVEIEACGEQRGVEQLITRLQDDAPEMARVDSLSVRPAPVECRSADFYILNSRGSRTATIVERDTAVCRDCLAEMFDPANRRWRYAFANCPQCGPRYTICRTLPLARERSSLKPFNPCAKCQNETQRADDRHYQNEVNCCPKCGPQLALLDAQGQPMPGDAVVQALALLQAGRILAIKGVGGFHLACDARTAAAVALLRERRQGDEKPFAVLIANATSASAFVQLGVGEPGLLGMPERPIILLKKRSHCDATLPGVATGLRWLGVMLPSTALQYLLFHAAAGSPEGLAWLDRPQELALVMSSADVLGEPVVIDNGEAVRRLSGIADAFLVHDREIVARCEDSVARTGPGGLQLVRRARGYAPRPLKLPRSGPPVLAVGGRFKNTVCVTRGDEAFVSPHIGDLDKAPTCEFFDETVAHLLKFLEIKPALIAHDFDTDFHSTRFAADFARQRGVPLLAVQHHHAHVAAVLAEHRVEGPAIALALDGMGTGADGAVWGGSLLRVDGVQVERLGRLAPIQLAAEQAARQPWRAAAAVLQQLGRGRESAQRYADQDDAASVAGMPVQDSGCATSSLGCYVNAAAGLLGVSSNMAFDGQAAMLLEGLAEHYGDVLPLDGGWRIENGGLNLLPLLAVLADESNAERGAALFHATLAAALADWVGTVTPPDSTIVGCGACFINLVLARGLRAQLGARGLHLIEARRVPPNDGGLALGQAWVAQHYLLD